MTLKLDVTPPPKKKEPNNRRPRFIENRKVCMRSACLYHVHGDIIFTECAGNGLLNEATVARERAPTSKIGLIGVCGVADHSCIARKMHLSRGVTEMRCVAMKGC